MKLKFYIATILILFCSVGLSIHLSAVDENIKVKDVEYLTGEDFVQLYFKIGKMIPIPDVFYPDKNNDTRIIMRINNVFLDLQKKKLSFKSTVINSVNIDNNPTYTDVEIRLKEKVNYRVFTNRKGLFIEFPKAKKIMAANRTPTVKTPPAVTKPAIKKTITMPPPKKKAANKKVKSEDLRLPPAKQSTRTAKVPSNLANLNIHKSDTKPPKGNRAYIKNIILRQKNLDMISFDIIMTKATNFDVIPIPNNPVRLAIDFKNTDSRRIKKIVDQLNVKKIRGAYNSASRFRLVFDLHYLKNYKVSSKNADGSILEVAFFNNKAAQKKHVAKKNKATKKRPNRNVTAQLSPIPKKKSPAAKKPAVKKPAAKKIAQKNAKLNAKKKIAKPRPKKQSRTLNYGKAGKTNIIVAHNANGIELRDLRPKAELKAAKKTIQKVPAKAAPIRMNNRIKETPVNNDFFDDEKSQVTDNNQKKLNSDPPPERNTSGITFLDKTIAGGGKKFKGDPMGFNFHNADLKDVIKIIAKISGLNIVMDPGISGRITSQLNNVPWDQALELFLKINGLDMIQEGNILRIGSVEKLAAEAVSRRLLKEARQMEDDLEVFTKTLSFAKVKDVDKILKKQLSLRGEILKDDRTNTLIISEIPQKITELKKLIDILDTANPQVSIEARIVETKTNFIESFGIQWGYNMIADSSHGNQTSLKFPNSLSLTGNQFISKSSPVVGPLGGYAVNLPATSPSAGTVFSLGNITNTLRLDMALTAMESDGHGRIISAPKTTTQNNMEATIMQGKQIPVQTIQNNTITVIYRPAALELKVTPQITADGMVVTKLDIKNNSADFGNLVNGIPPIETQTISTTVMVPDGGTIVIGGMYKVEKTTSKTGVPVLSKIPILGHLFRSQTNRNEQRELLVFITPRIIK